MNIVEVKESNQSRNSKKITTAKRGQLWYFWVMLILTAGPFLLPQEKLPSPNIHSIP